MLEPTNYETDYNSTISDTFTTFRSFLLTLTITLSTLVFLVSKIKTI